MSSTILEDQKEIEEKKKEEEDIDVIEDETKNEKKCKLKLNKGTKWKPWDLKESIQFRKGYKLYGNRWSMYGKILPQRQRIQIRTFSKSFTGSRIVQEINIEKDLQERSKFLKMFDKRYKRYKKGFNSNSADLKLQESLNLSHSKEKLLTDEKLKKDKKEFTTNSNLADCNNKSNRYILIRKKENINISNSISLPTLENKSKSNEGYLDLSIISKDSLKTQQQKSFNKKLEEQINFLALKIKNITKIKEQHNMVKDTQEIINNLHLVKLLPKKNAQEQNWDKNEFQEQNWDKNEFQEQKYASEITRDEKQVKETNNIETLSSETILSNVKQNRTKDNSKYDQDDASDLLVFFSKDCYHHKDSKTCKEKKNLNNLVKELNSDHQKTLTSIVTKKKIKRFSREGQEMKSSEELETRKAKIRKTSNQAKNIGKKELETTFQIILEETIEETLPSFILNGICHLCSQNQLSSKKTPVAITSCIHQNTLHYLCLKHDKDIYKTDSSELVDSFRKCFFCLRKCDCKPCKDSLENDLNSISKKIHLFESATKREKQT